MTDKQRDLLKAMHLIKDHCLSCVNCESCGLTYDKSRDGCPFKDIPANKWDLKPLEEEKDFSVFL